jgi:hypothetical protein
MPRIVKTVFRVHPAINFARVGTSHHYYLSPETSAGLPVEDLGETTGGLPIVAGSEKTVITSADLRDAAGNLKRQAARFRIFVYDFQAPGKYPSGDGVEVLPGQSLPDGRVVRKIIWTVHLANKKANAYNVVPSEGLEAYRGKVPQLRNSGTYGTADSPARLSALVIDPGPRAIDTDHTDSVHFDRKTVPTYSDGKGGISEAKDYPKSFPSDNHNELFLPSGPLDTLGELRIENGRLLVLPGFGRTAAQIDEYGDPIPLTGDLNNMGWFDDSGDGPVSATLVFDGGETAEVFGGWVVCGDPAYAPQIRNVVSVWDDVYDAWVRELNLQPNIYDKDLGKYDSNYKPSFETEIYPIFRASALQRWTANLPIMAVKAHETVDAIQATDDPAKTIMAGLNYIRNPNVSAELSVGVPLMPLSLGEAGTAFLAVSKTQYFFLEQWDRCHFHPGSGPALGPGEYLDMASLSNCLGGRYVPGIEVSYPIRQPDIYGTDWRTSGCGPFRIKHKALDYQSAKKSVPFLTGGWIPLHDMNDGLEPGDLSKFMSIPWQTDYNSCSIHQTNINTAGTNVATGSPLTLYWSWPSQRPDAVYPSSEVVHGVLPRQVWSIRGPGTLTTNAINSATFQKALQSVTQWDRIGVVLQGTVIKGDFPPHFYLEAESRLPIEGQSINTVPDWPFNSNPRKPKT